MYQDAPMYQVSWDFERCILGDQPLGWDQIGLRENIERFTAADFRAFKEALYVPQNMVILLCGAVDEKSLDLAAEAFGKLENKAPARGVIPFESEKGIKMISIRSKKTEQYHLSLGFPALRDEDPKEATLSVLSTLLGGNTSSRMFQHLREEKGLCYSIRTSFESYRPAGFITTQAGVSLDRLEEAIEGIRKEYEKMAIEMVSPQELHKAQQYLLGSLDLALEDPEYRAHDQGEDWLLRQKVTDYERWRTEIKAVTPLMIQDLARELFQGQKPRWTIIGPDIEEAQMKTLLEKSL